jgi:hypothetical protein
LSRLSFLVLSKKKRIKKVRDNRGQNGQTSKIDLAPDIHMVGPRGRLPIPPKASIKMDKEIEGLSKTETGFD